MTAAGTDSRSSSDAIALRRQQRLAALGPQGARFRELIDKVGSGEHTSTGLELHEAEEAMSLMLAQGAATTQKDAPIRIASAAMVATMVKFGAVPAASLDGVSRRVRENVEAETVALAASQDMMALGAVATKAEADKMAAQVRGALEELVKATGAAATRAAQAGAGDFNAAVFRGLIAIRDVCVKLPNPEQGAVAPMIAPLLEQVEALPADAGSKAGAEQRELNAAKAVCEALRGMLGLKGAAKK